MRSLFEDKRWIILVSVLALGALTVLAVGLREVPFREAQQFGRGEAGNLKSIPQSVINSIVDVPIWMQLSVWALFLFMVVLIGALLSPELRKRLIRTMIRVGLTYWLLYIFFTRYREILASMFLNPFAEGGNSGTSDSAAPVPEFAPPQVLSLTSYFVSFGIALLLVVFVWRAVSFWREYSASHAGGQSLRKLAGIARSSLQDLSSGRDSTDVIMNCYFRMSDVVADKRRLKRDAAMTPAEFAIRLENAGLPGEAVRRLTRLFENVRYGGHRSGTIEVNEAVACLTTILQHCGEVV